DPGHVAGADVVAEGPVPGVLAGRAGAAVRAGLEAGGPGLRRASRLGRAPGWRGRFAARPAPPTIRAGFRPDRGVRGLMDLPGRDPHWSPPDPRPRSRVDHRAGAPPGVGHAGWRRGPAEARQLDPLLHSGCIAYLPTRYRNPVNLVAPRRAAAGRGSERIDSCVGPVPLFSPPRWPRPRAAAPPGRRRRPHGPERCRTPRSKRSIEPAWTARACASRRPTSAS